MKRLTLALLLCPVMVLCIACGATQYKQYKTLRRITPELEREAAAALGERLVKTEKCAYEDKSGSGSGFQEKECRTTHLVYLGVSGDSIRIGYREYTRSLARPSFYEDVAYPRKTQRVVFREITFEILGLQGDNIRYKIISTPTQGCDDVTYLPIQ